MKHCEIRTHASLSRASLLFVTVRCTVACTVACIAAHSSAAEALRISQVYGGGGATSALASYNVDYIEIFNSGPDPVSLAGWTVEYGSAAGNWGSSAINIFAFPKTAVIAPCSYLLLASGVPSTGGAALPVVADFSFTMALSATNGKVGLFRAVNANVACGAEAVGTLVDKVAFGTANCSETTAVGVLSNTTGAVRNGAGMDDTDSNIADFTVVTTPIPHNAASATNPNCGSVPPPPCPADFNADGSVGAQDLAVLLGAWGTNDAAYDLNADGIIGAPDLAQMLGAWGVCPS